MTPVDLNERERRILQALIEAHIQTAEPVGSKSLAEQLDLRVSPATIRNVLAVLSEQGLIDQPHTSAGRVPTDRGLRYYVDSLVSVKLPTESESDEIAQRLEEATSVEGTLKEASRVLSRLSKQTALVIAARTDTQRVRHVEFLRLRDDAVLFIIVTEDGKVLNRLLEWRRRPGEHVDTIAPSGEHLLRYGQALSAVLAGATLEEGLVNLQARLIAERAALSEVEAKLLTLSKKAMEHSDHADVHIEGTSHLLSVGLDGAAVQRKRELLALLDEDEQVEHLLSHAVRSPGVSIFIGDENPGALIEQGVVAAPIGQGGVLGVLGVIGPRNLPYARVIPLVDLTAQLLARTLKSPTP